MIRKRYIGVVGVGIKGTQPKIHNVIVYANNMQEALNKMKRSGAEHIKLAKADEWSILDINILTVEEVYHIL